MIPEIEKSICTQLSFPVTCERFLHCDTVIYFMELHGKMQTTAYAQLVYCFSDLGVKFNWRCCRT